jgi:hypothetical protein
MIIERTPSGYPSIAAVLMHRNERGEAAERLTALHRLHLLHYANYRFFFFAKITFQLSL